MLKNETYAGTRYFNRMTRAKEGDPEGKKLIRGQWVYRDRVGVDSGQGARHRLAGAVRQGARAAAAARRSDIANPSRTTF